SLHHIATGLYQLHSAEVAHQDLKPSNILVFEGSTSKIADLGCASVKGVASPRDSAAFAGDRTYAPTDCCTATMTRSGQGGVKRAMCTTSVAWRFSSSLASECQH